METTTKPVSHPTRHSYSSLSTWKTCPAMYGYRYVKKLPSETTAAMDRGTRLHKIAEIYVGDHTHSIQSHFELRKIGLRLLQLRNANAVPEATWLLDDQWKPVKKEADAKIKAIVDVHYFPERTLLKIHDYKTGREYPGHSDQLELYVAMGLCQFPDARRAEGSALYIDTGAEGRTTSAIRAMLPKIIDKWDTLIAAVEGDTALLPTPGAHCARCPFGVSKGGPCQSEQRK